MSDPMRIRRQIGKDTSSHSPTPARNPFKTRGFGNGMQARSPELPTTNLLQKRPVSPPTQEPSQPQETQDLDVQLKQAEGFGYNGLDVPTFVPGATPPPTNPSLMVMAKLVNDIKAAPIEETSENQTVQREEMPQEEKPEEATLPGEERVDADDTVIDAKLESATVDTEEIQSGKIQSESITQPEILTPLPLQAKLTIGQPDDVYEQEADQVARQVVQRIHTPETKTGGEGALQRQEMGEEEEVIQKPLGESIQRRSISQLNPKSESQNPSEASADLQESIQGAKGSGQPLDESVKEPMEREFGADFSGVRVHTDATSDQLNQSIQAKAFTTGEDIFFRQGAYEPSSQGGQELLAHELTHVVQQNGETVQRSPQPQSKDNSLQPNTHSFHSHSGEPMIMRKGEWLEWGLLALGGILVIGGIAYNIYQDRKNEGLIKQFGHKHRNLDVNPDANEEQGGVHKNESRPDDAPIVDEFRQSYNQLENWYILIENKHPELWENFKARFPEVGEEGAFDKNHIMKEIKTRTKQYKAEFRNLDQTDLADTQQRYINDVNAKKLEIDNQLTAIRDWYKEQTDKNDVNDEELDTQVREEGTEMWREAWQKTILQVNTTLARIWPPAKEKLKQWARDTKKPDGQLYGSPEEIGELDYIGSTAKGYKGPPKQHIRFNPKDFDVDANLNAPPLSNYAQLVDGQTPDRERIFGKNTSIQPLKDFCKQVDDELEKNVENFEKDPSDPFDIALEAAELPEQKRGREGIEAIYKLRTGLDNETYNHVLDQLKAAGIVETVEDEQQQEHLRLPEELTEEQKQQLDQIIDPYKYLLVE